MAGGSSRRLFEPLVLLVAAVVLLDEDRRPPALLETLLLVVRPEFRLDQDGRLRHLLVESVLRGQSRRVSAHVQPEDEENRKRVQTVLEKEEERTNAASCVCSLTAAQPHESDLRPAASVNTVFSS